MLGANVSKTKPKSICNVLNVIDMKYERLDNFIDMNI